MLFKYGERVRDTVTGYAGKVTAYCDYYGRKPMQFLVEGMDATGRPIEVWCDENRLESSEKKENQNAVHIPSDIPQAQLVEEVPLTKEMLGKL